MKSPWRWLIRIGALLALCVVAAAFFRYDYTRDKSVRVDRLTGQQEVFCEARQAWTSLVQCYPQITQPADAPAQPR